MTARRQRPLGRTGRIGPADRSLPRRGLTDTLAFKTVALIVVAAIAVLLWQLATPRLLALAGGHEVGSRTVQAVVENCPGADACDVRFTDAGSIERVLPLTDPGMFRVGEGDQLTVRVDPSGRVALAGWQAWLDVAILLVLAVALTAFGVGWWKRVLEHDDPHYDGADPRDLETGYDEANPFTTGRPGTTR